MTDPKVDVAPGMGGLDSQKLQKPTPQPIEDRLQKLVDRALYVGGRPQAQRLRNLLNGTWLGEPLHVVLTDIPIGAWTAAMIFDAFSLIRAGREFAWAAGASIAIGLVGAAGSAVTG